MTRIYLVEDDETSRAVLGDLLGELGELRRFEAAEAAWSAIAAEPPDLLVTDVMLGGMSGVELCRKVRERHSRLDLPVMVVSAAEELDDLSRAYEAGADEYLVKPVEGAELRAKARLLLDRAAHRREETVGWQRYELFEPLGKGQTGATTYRARRREDGVELALKLIEDRAGPAATAALLSEAELLRALEDVPGITRVRDLGQDGGCTFYAMDLVRGATLRERLDRTGPLPFREAAAMARSLALCLAALAAQGVTHGDVKPSNLLLGQDGPVLLDFGLARRSGEAPARDRGGTLTYLAPEVVRGQEPGPGSDVYSWGVLLFESLSGRLPYAASGADLAAFKVEGGEADLNALLERNVPPGLVAVVEQALQADPARRRTQASELAVALLPYAS